MIDTDIWIGLFLLTAVLYLLKWFQCRNKNKVYRISADSLQRSKDVMLKVLPLVEDDSDHTLDASYLPYDKESVKSASKILAYYYWKKNQHTELNRVKNCFISLCRFQNRDLDQYAQERMQEREKVRLTREFECYITHSPFKASKNPE